jgi:glyoxylase I family protein
MTSHIQTGAVHHLTLTVNDVDRSREFYTGLLGFQEAMMFGPRALLSNGSVVLALAPSPDPSSGDRFDETRVGLDHLSFSVESRDDLEQALRLFDEQGVPHGEITDLVADLGIYILAFRDPDNIQVEMTAPYS